MIGFGVGEFLDLDHDGPSTATINIEVAFCRVTTNRQQPLRGGLAAPLCVRVFASGRAAGRRCGGKVPGPEGQAWRDGVDAGPGRIGRDRRFVPGH
jgi:hypothetical protein